jgi:hypothetical protein
MKRVLALLGACLLVAAAVVARGMITDDDDDGDDGGDGDGDLVVACIPELQEACEAIDRDLDLRIEDPAETIAAVAGGEEIDAWVTLDPWPRIANESESRELFDEGEGVATSGLALIVRNAAVPDACPELPTWTCLVDDLDDLVAVPSPRTALGLLVLAHAANDFRPGFAANELREDFDLQRRLAALDVLPDPVADMLVLPDPDATGTTQADEDSRIRVSAVADSLSAFPGLQAATVAVVVTGPDADRIAGEPTFIDALDELGWVPEDEAVTIGLPRAGVLIALQEVFS